MRAARRCRFLRRTAALRSRNRSFGSTGGNSIDTEDGPYRSRTPAPVGARPVHHAYRGCPARRIARWSSPTARSGAWSTRAESAWSRSIPALMQPSSLDVRVDRFFRVFRNSRYPYIDVKTEQEELTELVEVPEEEAFILHPGEFVLGSTLERITLPDDLVARLEGKSSLGRLGLLIHSTAGLHRPRLGRPRDARALERREPADHDLPRDEDRADLVRPALGAGRAPVRLGGNRLEVPGPARPDAEPLLAELPGRRGSPSGAQSRESVPPRRERRSPTVSSSAASKRSAKSSSTCATWLTRPREASSGPTRSGPRRRPGDRCRTCLARRSPPSRGRRGGA